MAFRVRWLGRVAYADAQAVQERLHAKRGGDGYLLLLEHPHVYTLGLRGGAEDVLVDPASVGAAMVRTNRGGQVTYHGPGQLVGYPIVDVAGGPGAVPAHMDAIESVVIEALAALGLPGCGRLDRPGHEGVWVDPTGPSPRKICAVGARVTRGRSMHGFALNVDPDLTMFDHIVPCGITDKGVTSLAAEGVDVAIADVVDAISRAAAARWAPAGRVDRRDAVTVVHDADVAAFTRGEGPGTPVRLRRLEQAGVDTATAVSLTDRKPSWMQVRLNHGPEVLDLKKTIRGLGLTTVCEEAGCPNLSECWSEGTATFMVLGERCTRACGFCLVDTQRPLAADPGEPERVAEAVHRMGLAHAVVTMVARDDLTDGGAAHVVATIRAIRAASPGCRVEVLISDMKGDATALDAVAAARPDVWNHNVETVLRLQRAVRPSASYGRSLAVLARGKAAGLVTKTSIIVGLGEQHDEVLSTLADLAALSVDIVTIGQYLRPTTNHLPVDRWWHPDELTQLKHAGEAMGIRHIEASPLTRSSYHARSAADAAAASTPVALGGRRR